MSSMPPIPFMELQDHVIDRGALVVAHILYSGWLRIDGEVVGTVRADPRRGGRLVVGRGARVRGKISAPELVVHGTVEGQIASTGRIDVRKTAHISGTVLYRSLELAPGAVVEARMQPLLEAG
jgi:cytoskeletal protein CcmA (bactofilin family)